MITVLWFLIGAVYGFLLYMWLVVQSRLWTLLNIFRPWGEDNSKMLKDLRVEDLSTEEGRNKLYQLQGSQRAYTKAWETFDKKPWYIL